MDVKNKAAVLSSLLNKIDSNNLSLEHPIQRKQNQFDIKQKSLLVDSVLRGYPIPPIYTYDDSGKKYVIDGKQRLSVLRQFVNNEFALMNTMPEISFPITDEETGIVSDTDFDLSGLYYENLPAEMQSHIMDLNLQEYVIRDCSEEELSEIFLRLNNGSPLNTSQKLKALTTYDIKKRISDIITSPFFEETVNFTADQINKGGDETSVLQIIMLTKGLFDFSKKGMMDFTKSYIYDSTDFDKIDTAVAELYTALGDKPIKYLRKVSLPMVVAAYISCKDDMAKDQYILFLKDFFEPETYESDTTYKDLCKSGTNQSTMVKARYETFKSMA